MSNRNMQLYVENLWITIISTYKIKCQGFYKANRNLFFIGTKYWTELIIMYMVLSINICVYSIIDSLLYIIDMFYIGDYWEVS